MLRVGCLLSFRNRLLIYMHVRLIRQWSTFTIQKGKFLTHESLLYAKKYIMNEHYKQWYLLQSPCKLLRALKGVSQQSASECADSLGNR